MTKGDRAKARTAEPGAGDQDSTKPAGRGRAAVALRILRDFSGLGQKQLAARTRVKDRRVGSYERGKSELEEGHLEALLSAMDLPYGAWAETLDFLDRLEWHRRKYRALGGSVAEGEEAAGLIADTTRPTPADALREIEWIAKSAGRAEERKTYDTLRMLLLAKRT